MPTVQPCNKTLEFSKCLGEWFVQRSVPTALDRNAFNGLELYTDDGKGGMNVKYTYNTKGFDGPQTTVYQKGGFKNKEGTVWGVRPKIGCFYLPFTLGYVVLDMADDYSWMIASSPSTTGAMSWLYIMTRTRVVDDAYLKPLLSKAEAAGWDMSKVEVVGQR
jgi:apolipoprotein D and lipocalin family protein